MTRRLTFAALTLGLLAGCSTAPVPPPSAGHLRAEKEAAPASTIPAPVQASPTVRKPRPAAKVETYSVVVNNVKVQELLFALARDAKINVDIHPGIAGVVTLNAIDQTLPQLLARIARQVDMRWELDGPNLAVMPDSPYLHTYRVDYVNMSRDSTGVISASSQIAAGAAGGGTASGGASGSGGNISSSKVENVAKNRFWDSIEQNIKDLLRETDKVLPEGSSETVVERLDQQTSTGTGAPAVGGGRTQAPQGVVGSPNPVAVQQAGTTVVRRATFREAASVIVNSGAGIITVRATSKQHEKVQEFLDQVVSRAQRQVMIEATIVEVELKDSYRQGIDWSRLRGDSSGFKITQNPLEANNATGTPRPVALTFTENRSPLNIALTLSLLEQFGNVKVLSSPKLSVLNNQAALLKVVQNSVYFTVKTDITAPSVAGAQPVKAFTTTPQTVSVGLVLMVTPQIGDGSSIILNVRPTITSISRYVTDPNPDLGAVGNAVPEIKTREIESVMRVRDGEIAVLGGLMQERSDFDTQRVPVIGSIPILGELFSRRDNAVTKSELVVFLRPVVIRDASIQGEFKSMRDFLPGDQFLKPPARAYPLGDLGELRQEEAGK